MPTKTELAIINWLANGDTCTASKTLAYWAAFDIRAEEQSHPREPADVRRCVKLLQAAPALRPDLSKMTGVSGLWAQIVEHWDEIERTIIEEVGGDVNNTMQITPKSYDLLQSVLSGAHCKKGEAAK